MSEQPLPKITPEPELIGVAGEEGREVIALPLGEVTIGDVLGEHAAPLTVKTEGVVEGNGIFEVEDDGTFVSPDGEKVYDPHSRQWVPKG